MKSFRTVIAAAVAVAVAVGLVGCAAATTTAADHTASIPAGQLGGAFTAASTGNAEQVLASAGIATVSDEKATAPIVGVTGTVRLTFTAAQVRGMTLEAADHGGISGATLDSTTNVASNIPPFAYLLAAWVKDAQTPGAMAMRKVMGTQTWTDAPQIVFPTIALSLFTADVVSALPAAADDSSGQGSTGVSAVREAAFIQSGVTTGIFSSVCTTVSGFIENVLNSVFSALQFNNTSTSGIGSFFGTIIQGAVGLARGAIQGLLSVVTAPVLSAIKTIAGTAAVVAQVVSYLKPWSVGVVADPSSVNAGDGGSLTATVDAGLGGADYPSTIKDCASAIGVTLPALSAANAKGVWDLSGAISTSDDTGVTLDDQSKSTISFTSSKSTSGSACVGTDQAERVGTARITVTRPDTDGIKELASSLLTHGLGIAGSIIGPVISLILSPIIDQVLSTVKALTDVSGAVSVTVVEPASQSESGCDNGGSADSTPKPSKSPAAACMVGTWTVTDGELELPSGTLSGMAGAVWTITNEGKLTEDFDGSKPIDVQGTLADYAGTQVETLTLPSASATSGDLLESAELSSTITFGGHALGGQPFHNSVGTKAGTWSCSGNSMTISSQTSFSTEVFHFARAAS